VMAVYGCGVLGNWLWIGANAPSAGTSREEMAESVERADWKTGTEIRMHTRLPERSTS